MSKEKKLLRFTTAGSVDDGKSTLIGRLLYDSKSIYQDQIDAVEKTSNEKGYDYVDLSLLTDGLKSEREQGITIDVAYRYFSTPKRKFIIADTPGHIEYTRNMVTGASTANLALILIDARKGIVEQTHRHAFIASLLRIPHAVVCVNKMDLVDYDQEVFENIVSDFKKFSVKLNIRDIQFVPISALKGDNVVDRSSNMNWYYGETLLYKLENVHISSDLNFVDCRFPIQSVIRPHVFKFQDFRGYAGRIESGIFKPGDSIKVLPSGFTSKIEEIYFGDKIVDQAFPPMSITMTLEDDIDISRGNMLIREKNSPKVEQNVELQVVWMNEKPLASNQKLVVKHNTMETNAIVREILYEIDINTLHRIQGIVELGLNSIGRIKLRLANQIFFDDYKLNKNTGSLILIDPQSFETLGCGMIIS